MSTGYIPPWKCGRNEKQRSCCPITSAQLATNQVMHDAKEKALSYHIFEDETAAGAWL